MRPGGTRRPPSSWKARSPSARNCASPRLAATVRAGDFAGARNLYLRLGDFRAILGFGCEPPSATRTRPSGRGCRAKTPACCSAARWMTCPPTRTTPGTSGPWRAWGGRWRLPATAGPVPGRGAGAGVRATAGRQTAPQPGHAGHDGGSPSRPAPPATSSSTLRRSRATPLAKEIEDWEALGITAIWRSVTAYAQTDPDAWSDAVADMDLATRSSGQPLLAYLSGANDYARAFLRGDFAEAERIAEHLLEIGRSFGSDKHRGTLRPADVHGPPGDRRAGGGPAPR